MYRYLLTTCFVLTFYGSAVFGDEDNIVSIDDGLVRGWRDKDGYYAYLGIPYATPPIGENRFKAPLPPQPWDGIFDANRQVMCPQNGEGEEDCLIVNVFVPENVTDTTLPVFVYIHGGSFIMGVGQSGGAKPLTDQDLVVVTINYRLGALGFLCLGTEDAPGNAGLKDQVAALKWVQKNIAHFNGDPGRVTIYGMSAGAASVDLLVLSETTEGLFQRAVLESGTATNLWTVDLDPIGRAVNVSLRYSGKNIDNLKELTDYYLSVPADTISGIDFDEYYRLLDGTFGFAPCVEKLLEGVTPFMAESPFITLYEHKYHKVPMMMFYATLEGRNTRSDEFVNHNYSTKMEENFEDFLPADLTIDSNEQRKELAKYIKHYYFGERPVSIDTLLEYSNFFGDTLVLHQFLNEVDAHSVNNTVFLMEFSFFGNMETVEEVFKDIHLAGHGSVIKYAILPHPVVDENDQLAVDRVSTIIADFVKYSEPIPSPSSILPIEWPRYQSTDKKYLHLNQTVSIGENPYADRKLFWDDIYAKFPRLARVPVDPGTVDAKIEEFRNAGNSVIALSSYSCSIIFLVFSHLVLCV